MSLYFMQKLSRDPGFWRTITAAGTGKGTKDTTKTCWGMHSSLHYGHSGRWCDWLCSDFCYNVPFPWLQNDTADSIFQDRFYSISAYTKVDQNGLPFFTSYFNVKRDWANSLQEKWRTSLTLSLQAEICPLLDHYSLLAMGLHELEKNVRVAEMVHMLYVCRL
jgi:hypothetical protein